MNGLLLSEKYYNEVLKDYIKKEFKDLKIAVGLMGYGSECYGYDDNISRDHDFQVMPVILLSNEDYKIYGEKLKKHLSKLPKTYMGFDVFNESYLSQGRRGVLNIDDYVSSFLITKDGPSEMKDYRVIPQYLFSAFTNGKIFVDEFGEISELREKFKFYPRDIRFNMIATRCMGMNSAYINFERSVRRKEYVACAQALGLFITNTIEMYFLIYERYCPYYKWNHKMLKEIDLYAYDKLNKLVDNSITYNIKLNILDEITNDVIDKLEEHEIIIRVADFLGYYGPVIQSRIDDEYIKNLSFYID